MSDIISRPGNPVFRDSMDRIFGTEKKKEILVYDNGTLKITADPMGGFVFDFRVAGSPKQLLITDEQFNAMCDYKGIDHF